MLELVLRLVFSLTVVIGMVMLLTRLSAGRFRGSSDALIRVVQRQALSRTSAVAVVTVGSRVLVVGTTEQQVQLLAELDPDEVEVEEPVVKQEAERSRTLARSAGRHAQAADTVLAGSLLSTHTWRQALAAATGKVQDAS